MMAVSMRVGVRQRVYLCHETKRNMCVRGNVFLRREMVGERTVVVCFLLSSLQILPSIHLPLRLLGVRLNWVWISVWGNSCIYLSVHSPSCY